MNTVTIEYPMSANYCKSWTILEAIRELIANALDEGDYLCTWADGMGTIKDFGKGIPKEYFVLGEGEQKSATQIGQFREGLKIAGLVFAREGRFIKGTTRDYDFEFCMMPSKIFNTSVVGLIFTEREEPAIGTVISFACTQEEIDITKGLFLPPEVRSTAQLLKDDKSLCINGVRVQTVNSLFGYNIIDKKAANRDRSVLDMEMVRRAITQVWAGNCDKETMTALLTSEKQYLEHDIYITPTAKEPLEAWTAVLETLYGTRYCLNDDHANILRDRGYTIITPLSWDLKYSLNNYMKVPYATEILKRKESLDYTNLFASLPFETRAMISEAIKIAEITLDCKLDVTIIRECSYVDTVYSFFDPPTKKTYVSLETVSKGLEFLLGALLHESIHQETDTDDSSAAFEWAMTFAFAKTALKASGAYLGRN